MSDWYYVGHYGQLGPLTREQVDELIQGGVIVRETFVWCTGMANWSPASSVAELGASFSQVQTFAAPPPPPVMGPSPGPPLPLESGQNQLSMPYGAATYGGPAGFAPYGALSAVESDRSRIAAGIMQLFLPGIGRIYLGYMAIGVLQLLFTIITCGVAWLWPFIDGVLILTGTPRLDGYGRILRA